MDSLPSDILYRIISFDVSSAPHVYRLNKAMRKASYSDPNFTQLIHLKFEKLVKYNSENSMQRTVSVQMHAIPIATQLDEVNAIIHSAIGHPEYSLNSYVSLLLQFGGAMNLQIANLQKNLGLGVLQIESLQTAELSEDNLHELISVWYQLRHRIHCMLQRINCWLKLHEPMQETIDTISYNASQWQGKMQWVITRELELRVQLNRLMDGLPNETIANISTFFSNNMNQQNLF